MDKAKKHEEICKKLNEIYKAKNHDYGDSFGELFDEMGIQSVLIRLTDKVNRLKRLALVEQEVKNESIEDTLIDLANYSIMTLIELGGKDE